MALAIATDSDRVCALDVRRFDRLWRRSARPGRTADGGPVYRQLVAHYLCAGRYYHTPDHVRHCVQQLDLARAHVPNPDAVELALWFHDVIYVPAAGDNELRSADWFATVAQSVMRESLIQRVHDLIMVTVHPSCPDDLDSQFVVDVDLSSFALPWARFKSDSRNVRREMVHLSDDQFFGGQMRFLRALLERPAFFLTDFFRERSEAIARDNITRVLEDLSAQGYSSN